MAVRTSVRSAPQPVSRWPPGSGRRTALSPVPGGSSGADGGPSRSVETYARGVNGGSHASDPGPRCTVEPRTGRPARSTRRVPSHRPGASPAQPSTTCSVHDTIAPAASRTRSVARHSARAATTVGQRARSSDAPSPTVTSTVDSAGAPERCGSTIEAATLRTASRAPSSTRSTTDTVSPPSGPAAADTRCTVSGPVRRTASWPVAPSTDSAVRPPGAPQATTSTRVRITRVNCPQWTSDRRPRPPPGRPSGPRAATAGRWAARRAPPRRPAPSRRGRRRPTGPGPSC